MPFLILLLIFGPSAVIAFIAWGLLYLIGYVIFGSALTLSISSVEIAYNYFTAEEIEYATTELYCGAVSYECAENDRTCLNRKHYIPASIYVKIDREQFAPEFITEPTVNITYTNDKILSKLQPLKNKILTVDKTLPFVSHDENQLNLSLISIDEENIFESDKFYEWIDIQKPINRFYTNNDIEQAKNKLTGQISYEDRMSLYDGAANYKICDEIGFINSIGYDEEIKNNKYRYLSALINNQITPRTDRFQDFRIKKRKIISEEISQFLDQYIDAYEERKRNKTPRYKVRVKNACQENKKKSYDKALTNAKNWKSEPYIIRELKSMKERHLKNMDLVRQRGKALRSFDEKREAKSETKRYLNQRGNLISQYMSQSQVQRRIDEVNRQFEKEECTAPDQSYFILSDNHDENLNTIKQEVSLTKWKERINKEDIGGQIRTSITREVIKISPPIEVMQSYVNAKLTGEEFFIVDRQVYYMNDTDIKSLEKNVKISTYELLENGYKPNGDDYRWCVNKININRETLELTAQTTNTENPYSHNLKSQYQCNIVDNGTIETFQKKTVSKRNVGLKIVKDTMKKQSDAISIKQKENKNKI